MPPVHAISQVLFWSHVIVHVDPGWQENLHVLPPVQEQFVPHSVVPGLPLSPDDVPPSFVDGVPLDAPLEPPSPELDDGGGEPLPIVQSYEHAPATKPEAAMTDRTETRCTLSV